MSAERYILVVLHTGRRDSVEAAQSVCEKLREAGVTPVVAPFDDADDSAVLSELGDVTALGAGVTVHELELVIVLGGDGTILRAAELVRGSTVPLLGVNLGHVGFLAESEREDLAETVKRALDRDYLVEERMTLSVRVKVDSEVIYESWALNEATVEKASR
ncbi:MAG: NAD(+)/NADH kinase, partial [Herbiconiux sp.]|nr:NAD(+)/NADH kinase [Herbiconiux sp.]